MVRSLEHVLKHPVKGCQNYSLNFLQQQKLNIALQVLNLVRNGYSDDIEGTHSYLRLESRLYGTISE